MRTSLIVLFLVLGILLAKPVSESLSRLSSLLESYVIMSYGPTVSPDNEEQQNY